MNGAATNNLQATTVPTNGGAATYTGRRLLGSKEAGLMQDILNMVLESENFYLSGLLFRTKSIQHRAGFFSSNGSAIADAAGNLSGEMDFGLRCFYDVPVGTKAPHRLCRKYGLWKRL
jgi:hypothetical protein